MSGRWAKQKQILVGFSRLCLLGITSRTNLTDIWQQLSNHWILVMVMGILPHFLYFKQVFFVEPSTGNSIEDAKLLEHLGTVALLIAFNGGPSDAEDAGVSENLKTDWSSCWNLVHNLNRYLHFGAGVHLLFPASVGKHGVLENLSFPSRISQPAMLEDTGEYIIIYHLVMTNIARLLNMAIYSELSHEKWWFSIVM